jgi:hypothetical protein
MTSLSRGKNFSNRSAFFTVAHSDLLNPCTRTAKNSRWGKMFKFVGNSFDKQTEAVIKHDPVFSWT